ncbi:Putative uncharacterized protein [Moritella viscosa]|uniref:hypothetical protein n=1 Tax=Moritella viscosa TaxID=80854 RepID=UPI0009198F21|nr:hypothetical protein [Moritella viscosa]SGY93143.1 Putative uncharacterized protein [Moritella viscosa]
MAKAIALHKDVYNLLIVENINNFTVSEMRDALMYKSEYFNDENETRRYIYRVICKLTKLKLLIKHANSAIKKIKYTKSETFVTVNFVIKPTEKTSIEQAEPMNHVVPEIIDDFINNIVKEKQNHEADLAITLSEVEEFKALIRRFPSKKTLFSPFYLETRERSAQLLGKVNALNKVLNTIKLAA